MIPRDDIITGISTAPTVALLTDLEEFKPPPRLRPLMDYLADIGLLQKKGDKYKKTNRPPPHGSRTPLAEAVAEIFQHVVIPHLAQGRQTTKLNPDLQRALYVYTSAFQTARIAATHELIKHGGTALVAGWFPCGFSAELMSIAGKDLVIVEEREDLVALEAERLALLPLAPAPLQQELAPASFYAFETAPLEEAPALAEKYGKFDTAIICDRHVDFTKLRQVAHEIYYIATRDKIVAYLNALILQGLGLKPRIEDDKTLRDAKKEQIGDLDVYILR